MHCIRLYYINFIDTDFELSEEDTEVWEDHNENDDENLIVENASATSLPSFSNPAQRNVDAILMWVVSFLLKLQAKFYFPDTSLELLISFFHAFIAVTGRFSTFMKDLANVFPRSLAKMLCLVGAQLSFMKYVVCRKCHTLHDIDSSKEKIGSRMVTKRCANRPFPDHPHRTKRVPCNCPLLKSIEVKSGQMLLYPYKIFCYLPIKKSLENFLSQPSFYKQCQHWKTRPKISNGSLSDIYDGAI